MSGALLRLSLLIVLGAGCGDDAPVDIPPECNGSISLCDRGFDEVAYATAHNAMSNQDDEWVNPNQEHGITRQLADGIRGLMLDTHYDGFEAYLCHGLCALGKKPLVDGLQEIADFLALHRGEVVAIIFETDVSADDTAAAFRDAGLSDKVYAHPSGAAWPTLRSLIDADTRLVVFTDVDGGTFPWYMDVWEHAWETHFAARDTSDFSCDRNRGDAGNALFIFNHFLTRSRPVPAEADATNANPFLIDRALECMTRSGALPNFVTVDFYATGDLFAAVDTLNGL